MPEFIIRGMSPELHRTLRDRAEQNYRSMNQEVLALLEEGLGARTLPPEPPVPFDGAFRIDDVWIRDARDDGRP